MTSLNAKDRTRSPRFPSQNLEDSIRYVESIYEGVHRSPIDSETAFRLMGFSGKTGTSAKALGSLRQYGLIEGIGDNTRVSDLALTILEPASTAERASAIQVASTRPDVFDAVVTRFDHHIPQADEPIRAFLIRELGFQKNSADECIRSLRQSAAFAEAQVPTKTRESESASAENSPIEANEQELSEKPTKPAGEAPMESVSIPLSRECRAEIKLYGELTPKSVANLLRHIELLSEVWLADD